MPPKKKAPAPRVALIMAGGSGERFWPLSRGLRPKQLLNLTRPDKSLLLEAVERILPLVAAEHVYVATSKPLAAAIRKARLPIPAENILAEPDKRNTAGCLCWAAAKLVARYGTDEVAMAVLTADHLIGSPSKFRAQVKAALAAAEAEPRLVTLGIKPTRPETGYGYIEIARGKASGAVPVVRFREKPSLPQAEEFLESGNFFWNSGMFFWRIGTFLAEMEAASPVHADRTREMITALMARKQAKAEDHFRALPDISIDYALLEKSPRVAMIAADFPWDDVGAWDALERSRKPDAHGNVVEGGAAVIDSRGCIVLNDAGESKISVGVLGAEDLVVIVCGDAVLVAPKAKAQEVRLVARELRKRGSRHV